MFPRVVEGRGTDKRAGLLQGEYQRKLARYDRLYHGATGPLVRRLDSYGKLESLVVGPWGDCSKDLHILIKNLAETRLAATSQQRGREGSDLELGYILGQIRRVLSVSFVRAQSLCLLARLCHLGEGAKEAAGRRKQTREIEERRRSERLSHYEAHVRGRGLGRIGSIFVP